MLHLAGLTVACPLHNCRELGMCAAVSVKVCYRVGETEGNGDVCCS